MASRDTVEEAVQILGYTFRDPSLLTEALTHASSAGHRLQSNERMEFLGDAILNYVVCEYLFLNYPQLLEGDMTKVKSAVVSRKVCAKVSDKSRLSSMLNLGKGVRSRPELPMSIAAAVFESTIAAIYLDGGILPARKFILKYMMSFIEEFVQSAHQHNFKSVLQQYAQKHLPRVPTYNYLDEKGPDHSKCFEVCVQIESRLFASAWANSKKEAEQMAALEALRGLGLAKIDEHGHVILCQQEADSPARKPVHRCGQGQGLKPQRDESATGT